MIEEFPYRQKDLSRKEEKIIKDAYDFLPRLLEDFLHFSARVVRVSENKLNFKKVDIILKNKLIDNFFDSNYKDLNDEQRQESRAFLLNNL